MFQNRLDYSNLWRLRIEAPQTSLKSRDLRCSHMIESFFYAAVEVLVTVTIFGRNSVSQYFLFLLFSLLLFAFSIYERYIYIEMMKNQSDSLNNSSKFDNLYNTED